MRAATAFVLLLAVAAPSARAALGPAYGGRLAVALTDLPATTAPGYVPGAGALALSALVHETLVRVGPDGLARPALADGWGSSADAREWTLHLADAASFHDGRTVSAADAVRSLRRFAGSASPLGRHLAAALEGGPAGISAPDDRHVRLRYAAAVAEPLLSLASPAAAITGPDGAAAGPFVPRGTAASGLTLRAFDAHVGGRPFLDRVDVVPASDAQDALASLQAGRAEIALLDGGAGTVAATLLLVLDPAAAPLDRDYARAAIAAAFDAAPLVPRFVRGGDPARCLVPRALLAPIPAPVAPAPPRLAGALDMAVSRDVAPLVSQRVVAVLGGLGLSVRADPLSPAAAAGARAPLRLLSWTPEVPEAGLALRGLAALSAPPADVAEMLGAADATLDRAARAARLAAAETAWQARHVLVPLGTAPVTFRVRHGAHDASVDLAGRLRLEDAWIEP